MGENVDVVRGQSSQLKGFEKGRVVIKRVV
jgi:hypothetical protein